MNHKTSIESKLELIRCIEFTCPVMIDRIMKCDDYEIFKHLDMAAENGQIDWEKGERLADSEFEQARIYVEAAWEQFN